MLKRSRRDKISIQRGTIKRELGDIDEGRLITLRVRRLKLIINLDETLHLTRGNCQREPPRRSTVNTGIAG